MEMTMTLTNRIMTKTKAKAVITILFHLFNNNIFIKH